MNANHTVAKVRRPDVTFKDQIYLVEVWKGLVITTRHLLVFERGRVLEISTRSPWRD